MSDAVNVKILGEERKNETIDLVRTKFVDYVSHGSRLTNCILNIHGSARGIVLHAGVLIGCEFHALRRFTGFDWHDVTLEQCRFIGEFDNCRFGPRPTLYPTSPQGCVVACDFSQARLGWCEFYNCKLESQKLPGWPTFTVHEPLANREAWMKLAFPESYAAVEQKLIAGLIPDLDLAGLVAVTQNARHLARRHGMTVEAVREVIANCEFITS